MYRSIEGDRQDEVVRKHFRLQRRDNGHIHAIPSTLLNVKEPSEKYRLGITRIYCISREDRAQRFLECEFSPPALCFTKRVQLEGQPTGLQHQCCRASGGSLPLWPASAGSFFFFFPARPQHDGHLLPRRPRADASQSRMLLRIAEQKALEVERCLAHFFVLGA